MQLIQLSSGIATLKEQLSATKVDFDARREEDARIGHKHPKHEPLQAQFCKHLRATNDYCPTCGSTFDDKTNIGRDESVDDISGTDPETKRDIEDKFITNPDDKQEDVVTGGKIKRSIIPRRNKETPSS